MWLEVFKMSAEAIHLLGLPKKHKKSHIEIDYDSEIQSIGTGASVVLTHNLGTLDTLVYLEYSGNSDMSNTMQSDRDRVGWHTKTTTQITVENVLGVPMYFRLRMWKLS